MKMNDELGGLRGGRGREIGAEEEEEGGRMKSAAADQRGGG